MAQWYGSKFAFVFMLDLLPTKADPDLNVTKFVFMFGLVFLQTKVLPKLNLNK